MRLWLRFIQAAALSMLIAPWCASAEVADSPAAPAEQLWLPEPTWAQPMREVPVPTPVHPNVQPEPIPLPPAAVAIVGPALLTAIMARLSLKRKRPRARVMR